MSGRVLLDTNIVIALFAEEPTVMQELTECEEVFVSSVALGELYFGAGKSARAEENASHLDAFAAASAVLGCDAVTAKQYGAIKTQLKTIGSPIPENDIWIAAIATQHKLVLATRDSHFKAVTGLQLERW